VITPENTKSGLLQVVKKHRPSGRLNDFLQKLFAILHTTKNGLEIVIKQIEKKNLKFYMLS
jgi:hypothetical protein